MAAAHWLQVSRRLSPKAARAGSAVPRRHPTMAEAPSPLPAPLPAPLPRDAARPGRHRAPAGRLAGIHRPPPPMHTRAHTDLSDR